MSKKRKILVTLAVVVAVALLLWLVKWCRDRQPAQDEAMQKGIPVEFFAQAENEADYFRDMDGGGQFTPEQVKGRNTWMIWTGGNEAFWNHLAQEGSFGTHDLLKTLSSYPCSPDQAARARRYEAELAATPRDSYGGRPYGAYGEARPPGEYPAADDEYGGDQTYDDSYRDFVCKDTMYPPGGQAPYRYYSRDTRFCYQGLMNEPGFVKARRPDEWGLCLDERVAPPEPFDPEVYGRPSGVLGLRLYPNPEFFEGKDAERAQAHWQRGMERDAFYTDRGFYSDRNLIRPYRVGMACTFCHVSPHPLHPPEDPENPEFRNLSGTIGAQYYWFGRVLGPYVTPDNFVWHLLGVDLPGTVDTSFLPADNLNNPRALNSIFNVAERLAIGEELAYETSAGGALDLPEVQQRGPSFGVPHILWDGADSVGIDAALTRVYINIGEYHQEWLKHISLIVGLGTQSPITVKAAQENSIYWQATQQRAAHLAQYLIRAGYPMRLEDAPGGPDHLTADATTLERGKVAFAENCARCHSSKLPKPVVGLGEKGCVGEDYRECWDRFWQWTEGPDFKRQMTEIVRRPDFLDGNYLSSDARIPVDVLATEICSAMASNAAPGHVWDNFASHSYQSLPSAGAADLWAPLRDSGDAGLARLFAGAQEHLAEWEMPAGGRGYQRVPTLISIWATAPYLHNNEVGVFTGDPSVAGRMHAFEVSIRELLWPGKRGTAVHRTSRATDIAVSTAALPSIAGLLARLRGLVSDGEIRIGPVPKGTPINLLSNLNLDFADPRVSTWGLVGTVAKIAKDLKRIKREGMDDAEAAALLSELVPDLVEASACPDYVVNRGHEFGSELSDADKEALIAFVKTF